AILWDVAERKERIRLMDGSTVMCKHVAYSPDGKMIGLALGDASLKLWDAQCAILLHDCRGHTDCLQAVAFSPDSRMVATASNDETVRLWDVATGNSLALLRGHTRRVWSVAFAPDGQTLASGSRDRTVRLWDPQPSKVWEPLCSEGTPVTAIAAANAC